MTPKILSISDIHFGHNRVPALYMREKLFRYMFPKIKDADVIFIGGDIFHTLLSIDCSDARTAVVFILDMLHEAHLYNTKVRVLRGTYSHDRDQSKILESISRELSFEVDFKYFDTIDIEHIEDLNLKVLYVPDDLPYDSSEQVITKIKNILNTIGWDNVDIMIGHGYFEHVLPAGMWTLPKITFNIKQFEHIVKKYILMGHIHTSSIVDKVIYNGSFDRLAHGEEEDKGFFFIDKSIHFIKNEDAEQFITIDISKYIDKTTDEIIDIFVKLVKKKFKKDNISGYVRCVHPSSEIRQILHKIVQQKFPLLKYSHKASKTSQIEKLISEQPLLEHCESFYVTEDNLPEMINNFIKEKNIPIGITIDKIESILKSL